MVLSELRKTPHLSASGIGEYVECSLLYRFGRIDKLPFEFRSDNLEFGTVIHRVLGEFYQARMTGDRMPLNDVHSLFEESWRAVAELNEEIRYSNGKDFQSLLINGIDLLTAWYHKLPDDNFRVLSVEEAFSFNIKDLPLPRCCQRLCVKFVSAIFWIKGRLPATFPMGFDLQRSSIFKQTKVSRV